MPRSRNYTNASVAFTPEGEFITVITAKDKRESGVSITRKHRETMPEYRFFPAYYNGKQVTFNDCPGFPFCHSGKCQHTNVYEQD